MTGTGAAGPNGGTHGAPHGIDWVAVGRRLREARVRLGLTQKAAAARAQVHHVSISRWEHGDPMRAGDVRQLAAAYGADVDWLLGGPRALAPTDAPPDVHLPSYWRGRMEAAASAMAAMRVLAADAERDVRGLLASPVLRGGGPELPETPNAAPALTGAALADLTDDELAPMLRAPSPPPRTAPDPPPPAAPRGASPGGAAPRPRHRRKA